MVLWFGWHSNRDPLCYAAQVDLARMLVTSYCFPPYSDTAGVVAAKRVRQMGEPVDVICNAMDSIRRVDPSLVQIGGELVQRFVALPTPTRFSSWSSIVSFVTDGYALAQDWQAEQGDYEVLYSRAQFVASHFLAARIKVDQPHTKWIAEFSDPLSHDVEGKVRSAVLTEDALTWLLRSRVEGIGYALPNSDNLLEWSEWLPYALADEIIFTNRNQRDFMLSHAPEELRARVESISTVSHHPTLPRDFYQLAPTSYELPDNKVNIGYFGNFYSTRGVGMVFQALAKLPKRFTNFLLLHIFTSNPDELKEEIDAKGLGDCVKVGPYVPYLEFLNITDHMDVLLVNDAVTPEAVAMNPFLPSKLSDYKGSTSAIWGIVEEGSPMDQLDVFDYKTPVEHFTSIQSTLAQLATLKWDIACDPANKSPFTGTDCFPG